MGYIDRYKRRQARVFPDPAKAPFIEKSLNRIEVQKMVDGEPLEELLEAVLIFKDKEGPDSAILYTYVDDGLEIGDTIVRIGTNNDITTNAYFILAEEVKRVDGSRIIKVFKLFEVNSWVKIKGINQPTYIVSNIKKSINTTEDKGLESEDKTAFMVAPSRYGISINDYLTFVNIISGEESYAGWRVEGVDDVSSPFINYIHISQELKLSPPPEVVPDPDLLPLGSNLVLESLNGYIQTDAPIRTIERTALTIEIKLPIVAGTYSLNLKDANGEIITKIIKVG